MNARVPNSIPKLELLKNSPAYFIKEVFGYLITSHHYNILEHITKNQFTVDLAPRGSGKTRIGDIGYCTWLVCNNPNIRIMILSDVDSHARRFLGTIKNALVSSPVIKQFYGDMEGPLWTDHEIITEIRTDTNITEASITALGAISGGVTSKHVNVMICDDIANFANTRTAAQRDKPKQWFQTTVLPALLPGGSIHDLGTLYHYADFHVFLQKQLNYDTQIQPAIIDEGASNQHSIWEDFMPLKTKVTNGQKVKGLLDIKEDLGSLVFGLQYMLSTELQKSGSIFKWDDFRFYSNIQEENGVFYVETDEE